MNNTKETKSEEKRSFKEVVIANKHAIITGAACVATCVLGCLLIKEIKVNKVLKDKNTELLEKAFLVNNLNEEVELIQEAMSEGMIQEAIATTVRKLNFRTDKRDHLLGMDALDEYRKLDLNRIEREIKIFTRRLTAYNALKDRYYIED